MKIIIYYKNKTFDFNFGYEAMIFDCAVSNNFNINYGEDTIKNFVDFVSKCYLKAPHDISLGELTDFIVTKWVSLKVLNYCEFFYTVTANKK